MTDTERTNNHQAVKNAKPNGVISVQASGEVSCPPDIVQFTISISSSKETFEAAQASVKRRSEYVVQVLRNNGIKEKSVVCSSDVVRGDEVVTMATDIMVQSDSLSNCEIARNLLIEKLDHSVQVTPLTYHHTSECKDRARQEAFRKAAENAKSKAQCIAQTVGIQIGPALELIELGQDLRQDEVPAEADPESSSHYVRFRNTTLHYSCKVSIVFESTPARSCSHKKCRKH